MRIRRRFVAALMAACFLPTAAFSLSQSAKKPSTTHRKRQAGDKGNAHIAPLASGADTYVVRQGDSLYTIARAHRTSIASLKEVNNLRSSRLSIGQVLRLAPAKEALAGSTEKPHSAKVPVTAQVATSESVEAADLEDSPTNAAVAADNANPAGLPAEGTSEPQPGLDGQPLRLQLASTGMGMLGVRYRWNGNSEKWGFDCSGLVKSLYERFNISLPRSSKEQYKIGEKVEKDKLEVGDLVFFSSRGRIPSHVGIYLGDNQFLHAARKARRVIISNLTDRWYTKRFIGARRLLDLWAEEPPAPAETKPD